MNNNKKSSFLKNSLQLLCVRNVFDHEKKNANSSIGNKFNNIYVHHSTVPELIMKSDAKSQADEIFFTNTERTGVERLKNQGNEDRNLNKKIIPHSFSNPDYYGAMKYNKIKKPIITPYPHDKNIIFEAKINTQKVSETGLKFDGNVITENETNVRLYRVKMRPKSNLDRRDQQNISSERSKRSLSDTAVITPTKKSVRFADSIGLDLENILNVNKNDRLTTHTSELNLRNFNAHNSDFIHLKNENPRNIRKNIVNVQIISVTENVNKSENLANRLLPSVLDCNQKQKLLRMNFCNNIKTRYNANGKLESEV
jgi:hypothetical protein